MNTPRIIIGSETEYATVITKNQKPLNDPCLVHEVIQEMLEHVGRRSISFRGTKGGIADEEEHSATDEVVLEEKYEKRQRVPTAALQQRRGYSGFMLQNGARCYEDCTHFEYSCPETDNPHDAVLVQLAGDRIVESARIETELKLRKIEHTENLEIIIYKNNSDGHGKSYGAHENYSLNPKTFSRICPKSTELKSIGSRAHLSYESSYPYSPITMLFFVARQILIGAGKTISESESNINIPYQISQRADFMERPFSMNTMSERGIVNIRDYPYADREKYRRLHVICGDANMSELSLFLKFGISGLFFMMLDSGFLDARAEKLFVPLKNPVRAFQTVSHDLTLSKKLLFCDGRKTTALEIMREIAELAQEFTEIHALHSSWQDAVRFCKKTLLGLENDRKKDVYAGSLDWVAKEKVLSVNKKIAEKKWHIWTQNDQRVVDLQFHDLNPETSIASRLKRRKIIISIFPEEKIVWFMESAPETTRAWLRGEIICRYEKNISLLRWDRGSFQIQDKIGEFEIDDPYLTREESEHLLVNSPSFDEFLNRLNVFICSRHNEDIPSD